MMSQLEIGLKWVKQLVLELVFQGVQCVLNCLWQAEFIRFTLLLFRFKGRFWSMMWQENYRYQIQFDAFRSQEWRSLKFWAQGKVNTSDVLLMTCLVCLHDVDFSWFKVSRLAWFDLSLSCDNLQIQILRNIMQKKHVCSQPFVACHKNFAEPSWCLVETRKTPAVLA